LSILFFMQSRPLYDVVRLSSYRYFLERTMEMKRMKKPLAWLLSALMLFTALPVTVFADEVAPAVTASMGIPLRKQRQRQNPSGDRTGTEFRSNSCSVGGSPRRTPPGGGTEFRPYGRANGNTHRGTCPETEPVPSQPPRRQ
jgi:hypothetical protein